MRKHFPFILQVKLFFQLKNSSSTDESEKNYDYSYYQQYMDDGSSTKGKIAKRPKYNQHDGDDIE